MQRAQRFIIYKRTLQFFFSSIQLKFNATRCSSIYYFEFLYTIKYYIIEAVV